MGIVRRIIHFGKRMVENVLVFGLVHVIYFLGGILAAYVVPPLILTRVVRGGVLLAPGVPGALLLNPHYHLSALSFAVLCGFFGPWLYHRYTMRGRGDLAAIREASAMQSASDWQRVADNTSFQAWREGIDQHQGAHRPEDRAQGVARDKSPQ